MVVDGAVMVPHLGFFYWNQQPKAQRKLFPLHTQNIFLFQGKPQKHH